MHPYQLPYMEPWGISVASPAMCNWPLFLKTRGVSPSRQCSAQTDKRDHPFIQGFVIVLILLTWINASFCPSLYPFTVTP